MKTLFHQLQSDPTSTKNTLTNHVEVSPSSQPDTQLSGHLRDAIEEIQFCCIGTNKVHAVIAQSKTQDAATVM